MIDFGFDKIALIGAVALIVIGPEKLPRVARTIGHMVGKAQRYVADVKAEVNRSIELEELQKMKQQMQDAAADVQQAVRREGAALADGARLPGSDWARDPLAGSEPDPYHIEHAVAGTQGEGSVHSAFAGAPVWQPPRKNWRARRSAVPRWYKQRMASRQYVQSGAARVARHRPPGAPR